MSVWEIVLFTVCVAAEAGLLVLFVTGFFRARGDLTDRCIGGYEHMKDWLFLRTWRADRRQRMINEAICKMPADQLAAYAFLDLPKWKDAVTRAEDFQKRMKGEHVETIGDVFKAWFDGMAEVGRIIAREFTPTQLPPVTLRGVSTKVSDDGNV